MTKLSEKDHHLLAGIIIGHKIKNRLKEWSCDKCDLFVERHQWPTLRSEERERIIEEASIFLEAFDTKVTRGGRHD